MAPRRKAADTPQPEKVEDDIARILAGEEVDKDKTQAVLDELRHKSSGIVVGGILRGLKPVTLDDAVRMLNKELGIDGWECDVVEMGHHAVRFTLKVRVDNKMISRVGIGMPHDSGEGTYRERLSHSLQEAFANALFGFGVESLPLVGRREEAPKPDKPGKPAIDNANGQKSKPKEEKPKEKTASDYVAEWDVKLRGVDAVNDLNEMLPQLKPLPPEAKKAVWDLIGDYAKKARGWVYDPKSKQFVDPHPPADEDGVGEAIPF